MEVFSAEILPKRTVFSAFWVNKNTWMKTVLKKVPENLSPQKIGQWSRREVILQFIRTQVIRFVGKAGNRSGFSPIGVHDVETCASRIAFRRLKKDSSIKLETVFRFLLQNAQPLYGLFRRQAWLRKEWERENFTIFIENPNVLEPRSLPYTLRNCS